MKQGGCLLVVWLPKRDFGVFFASKATILTLLYRVVRTSLGRQFDLSNLKKFIIIYNLFMSAIEV